jgi:WD40 repeat protein
VDRTLRLWDIESGQTVHVLEGHTKGVRACAFSSDGSMVLSASADHTLRLWHVASIRVLARFDTDRALLCCVFSPNGRRAVTGGNGGALHILCIGGGADVPAAAHAAATVPALGATPRPMVPELPALSAPAAGAPVPRHTMWRWWPFGRRRQGT